MAQVHIVIAPATAVALLASVTDAAQRRAAFEGQIELIGRTYGCADAGCSRNGATR